MICHHNLFIGFCRVVVVWYLFDFYSKHLLYISSVTVIVVKYSYFITWTTIRSFLSYFLSFTHVVCHQKYYWWCVIMCMFFLLLLLLLLLLLSMTWCSCRYSCHFLVILPYPMMNLLSRKWLFDVIDVCGDFVVEISTTTKILFTTFLTSVL